MKINYLKHWLLQFYTFTLWRTLFERTKRQTVKWTTDHPPLPGNREEKALAGVILQKEVLVRNKELTSDHQPGFWRGQKEMGDCSAEVLPTSQDPPHWNPSRPSDACAPRKDPNSEWLARDKPETNPMTRKPETVSHVAEQFSPFPSPSCSPPQQPFPIVSRLNGTPLLGQFICKCQTRSHSQALEEIPLPSPKPRSRRKYLPDATL